MTLVCSVCVLIASMIVARLARENRLTIARESGRKHGVDATAALLYRKPFILLGERRKRFCLRLLEDEQTGWLTFSRIRTGRYR